eukprot:CAMPEP_0114116130 /NCGR_PEP_ID=MMETSP0043_2-20121206/4336_1 /TAXON_ID=464988 /ORGANISM="Hemiselmis andersenii, Strain CCMP644" /LENGTH=78 /DNA_ID=CAMNT_0001208435 /DNA_START=134 /DNA_END=367 /DNA_ORIENTATION=+
MAKQPHQGSLRLHTKDKPYKPFCRAIFKDEEPPRRSEVPSGNPWKGLVRAKPKGKDVAAQQMVFSPDTWSFGEASEDS